MENKATNFDLDSETIRTVKDSYQNRTRKMAKFYKEK